MLTHSRYRQSKGETDSSAQQRKIIHYVTSNAKGTKKITKRIKDAITSSCVTLVVNDGRPFHLLQGHGFLHLAKEIYDSGRLMPSSTNIAIEELLPDPTMVNVLPSRMRSVIKETFLIFLSYVLPILS